MACQYAESVQILDTLPEFITYNEAKKYFEVFTGDVSDAGVYTIAVRASIEVPKDYTLAQTEIMSSEVTLKLEVVADCDATKFVDWKLQGAAPIDLNVLSGTKTVSLGPVDDLVSLKYGDSDGLPHCGHRAFRIIDDSQVKSFINIDSGAQDM